MILIFLSRLLPDPLIKFLDSSKGYLTSIVEDFYIDIIESTKCELY